VNGKKLAEVIVVQWMKDRTIRILELTEVRSMHRPQKTSKDGYPLKHKVEPEHTAEACSILHAEPRRREGDLYNVIKVKYLDAHTCSLKIKKFIEGSYTYELTDEEMIYLTIHIARVIKDNNG
jgi:transcriptional antiterminator